MRGVDGVRLSALDGETVRDATDTLVAGISEGLSEAGDIAVLPDAHYPYHASTGMITNPAVVEALAKSLGDHATGASVDVVIPGHGSIDPSSVATWLGYGPLSRDDHLTVTPFEVPEDQERAVDGPPTPDSQIVPGPLADAPVLVVPTVRVDHEVGFAGALATLTRAVGGDPARAGDVTAALRAVAPVGAVADATYVFTGTPFRASTILGSSRLRDVDRAIARLLSPDAGTSPPLAATSNGPDEPAVAVRGLSLEELRARLPAVEPLRPDGPGRVVRAGYRLYAKVSGDVYPPHLRTGR